MITPKQVAEASALFALAKGLKLERAKGESIRKVMAYGEAGSGWQIDLSGPMLEAVRTAYIRSIDARLADLRRKAAQMDLSLEGVL